MNYRFCNFLLFLLQLLEITSIFYRGEHHYLQLSQIMVIAARFQHGYSRNKCQTKGIPLYFHVHLVELEQVVTTERPQSSHFPSHTQLTCSALHSSKGHAFDSTRNRYLYVLFRSLNSQRHPISLPPKDKTY